jgi:SRSO17 transposase
VNNDDKKSTVFDPERWGLSKERIQQLPGKLRGHWEHYRANFRTQTRDTSEQAYTYLRGQLTMAEERHYAGIARQTQSGDGQALQHFMSHSPWDATGVYAQIQSDIRATPELQQGSVLILDESADEKAGGSSAGVGRQYNGRLGKIDESQVGVVLGYANWQNGLWPSWAIVDSELYLPPRWFGEEFAALRQKVGVPAERVYQNMPGLGLDMIRRAKARQLPFAAVACDDLYGRDSHFRAQLAGEDIVYYADVPKSYPVYLQKPEMGLPEKTIPTGRKFRKERMLNGLVAQRVEAVAQSAEMNWQRLCIRPNERGLLEDEFAARRVWTLTEEGSEAREEWLIVRIERNGDHTYLFSNAPADAPLQQLAEGACSRYFVERSIQDAKQELGWAEFQAQKYQGWVHHTALTACALWFIAETKLDWAKDAARDPQLRQQLEVDLLPALSTANVRDLLKSVYPLPELSLDEARQQIASHLVNRSRSKASRLRHRHRKNVKVQT